jgi:hypothetical protein
MLLGLRHLETRRRLPQRKAESGEARYLYRHVAMAAKA